MKFYFFNLHLNIFILSITLTVNNCFSQTSRKQPDWKKDWEETFQLSGNVAKITRLKYKAIDIFGTLNKGDLNETSIEKFNTNGNIVEEAIETEFEFDNKIVSLFSITKYDNYGNPMYYSSHDSNTSKYSTIIVKNQYDKTPILTNSKIYFSNGALKEEIKYKYDTSSNLIEKLTYFKDGSLIYKSIFKFDKHNYKTEEIEFYGNSKEINFLKKYKYDKKGKLIEWQIIFPSDTLKNKIYKYQYNEKGLRLKETIFINHIIASTQTYLYDNKNNKIEIIAIIYSEKGQFEEKKTLQYTNDSKGNWTELIIYKSRSKEVIGFAEFIYNRLIDYYP